jgi:hypothetical protein
MLLDENPPPAPATATKIRAVITRDDAAGTVTIDQFGDGTRLFGPFSFDDLPAPVQRAFGLDAFGAYLNRKETKAAEAYADLSAGTLPGRRNPKAEGLAPRDEAVAIAIAEARVTQLVQQAKARGSRTTDAVRDEWFAAALDEARLQVPKLDKKKLAAARATPEALAALATITGSRPSVLDVLGLGDAA